MKFFKIFALCCLMINTANAINFQQWQTNNGAKVLFMESHDLAMLDIRVVFDAGSSRDGNQFGLANLSSRLIATSTKTKNEEQISVNFESLGAIFGRQSLRDMSIVSLRTLSDNKILNQTVDTFADVLLNPVFDVNIFRRQQKLLSQQIKVSEQSPAAIAAKNFTNTIYDNHPYGHSPLGTQKTVAALNTTDIEKFYQRYFIANNATMVIVGDLTLAQAKLLANKVVGKLPVGKKLSDIPKVRNLEKAIKKTIDFPSEQTHILIGQVGVSRTDVDYFPLYLGNHILGGSGLVSRLSHEIREKNGLAYSAYSYFSPMRKNGSFRIGTQTKQKSTNEALKIAQKTLMDFIEKGPSEKEISDAKKNIAGGFALKINSNKKISEYLALIGFYNLPLDYLDTLVDKINKISKETVQLAWKKHINPEKMATILVGDFNKSNK